LRSKNVLCIVNGLDETVVLVETHVLGPVCHMSIYLRIWVSSVSHITAWENGHVERGSGGAYQGIGYNGGEYCNGVSH
jgi:hypothetical protein